MIGTAMLFLWQEFWFGAAAMESEILSYEKTVPKRCVAILDIFFYLHWGHTRQRFFYIGAILDSVFFTLPTPM